MADCILIGNNGSDEGGGIVPIGTDGRPTGDITIPEGVTSTAGSLLSSNTNITSVTTETSVRTLGNFTFNSCSNLTNANLKNVNSIGQSSFQSCSNLENVTIGAADNNTTLTIGSSGFLSCSKLSNIVLDSKITTINPGNMMFSGCSLLPDLVANKVLSLVANNTLGEAFRNCTSLQNITTPYLAGSMFRGCTGLKTVTVTSITGNTNMGTDVFNGCTALESVTLPASGITSIGNNFFYGCSSLASLTIPSTVTTIGATVFVGSGLASIIIPDTVTSLGTQVFRNCTSLASVTYSSGLTSIPASTFAGCTSLTSFSTPSSVTSIQTSAFEGCTSLETLSFPSSVVTVQQSAFKNCTGLTSISFAGNANIATMQASTANPFYGCTALEEVQVPSGFSYNLFLSNGTQYYTNVLTHDGIVNLINNLYDYTGGTAHTLTIGATNLARLSTEEKAVATAKNWTLT